MHFASDHSQLTKLRERIACMCTFIAATCYPSIAIFFYFCTIHSRDDRKSCKFASKIVKPHEMEAPLNRLNLKSPVCIFVTLPLQRDLAVARLNRWNCICAAPIQRKGTTCVVLRCMQQRTYIRAIRYEHDRVLAGIIWRRRKARNNTATHRTYGTRGLSWHDVTWRDEVRDVHRHPFAG